MDINKRVEEARSLIKAVEWVDNLDTTNVIGENAKIVYKEYDNMNPWDNVSYHMFNKIVRDRYPNLILFTTTRDNKQIRVWKEK